MSYPSVPSTQERKPRRALIWWGVALLVGAVLGGVAAAFGLIVGVGGVFVDAFTSDPHATPTTVEQELDSGTYLVYELTDRSRTGGPIPTTNGFGTTVAPRDVTVEADDGSSVPVGPATFSETITRGTSEYTGAVRFEIVRDGPYTVSVSTPNTEVVVAPSLVSGFTGTLPWFGLGGFCALVFVIGVVLLIVGLVGAKKSKPPAVAAGWYADPQNQATWRWWDGSRWTDRTG